MVTRTVIGQLLVGVHIHALPFTPNLAFTHVLSLKSTPATGLGKASGVLLTCSITKSRWTFRDAM